MRGVFAVSAVVCAAAITATSAGVPPSRCPRGTHVVPAAPPAGRTYAAAFPFFSGPGGNESDVTLRRLDSFERRTGKHLAWATFSNHWFDGHIAFPAQSVRLVWAHGSLPVVRMMPWSRQVEHVRDPVFSMADIAGGRWDAQLSRWADAARDTGIPLMVDFGPEMNGRWFPWNGGWAGGLAGAHAYRSAFRHLVTLFRLRGADNVSFAFHVDAEGEPKAAWNLVREYFPGVRYVDWVGASVYGSNDPRSAWEPFAPSLDRVLRTLRSLAPGKPVAVFEWGVAENPAAGDKGVWIADAFAVLARSRVGAASWWDERWRDSGEWTDLRVSSSASSLAAYRVGIGTDRYLPRPAFGCARNT